MEITFMGHSGFAVALSEHTLLFDYYTGQLPAMGSEPLYYFASHRHFDHFDVKRLQEVAGREQVNYIFSDDIRLSKTRLERQGLPARLKESIRFVSPHEIFLLDDLQIETLASTDEGVAFIVTCEGKTIYHAGDLNLWVWPGESEAYNAEMRERYLHELEKIHGRAFDAAFVPLDPRQGDWFYEGFDLFMRYTQTEFAFPMHFERDFSVISRLKALEIAAPYRDRVAEITREGQTFRR